MIIFTARSQCRKDLSIVVMYLKYLRRVDEAAVRGFQKLGHSFLLYARASARSGHAVALVDAVGRDVDPGFWIQADSQVWKRQNKRARRTVKPTVNTAVTFRWSAGLGERKLEEYCDIVRSETEGHHDDACRKKCQSPESTQTMRFLR
jgi:hypothetical protein